MPPKLVGKDLHFEYVRNNYDFDLDLFPFKKILRVICVSHLDAGVIIGEVDVEADKISKKTKKGLGFLTVKLKGMEDYHSRLFDFYTIDFVPKNIEQDVRVYHVVNNRRRPSLIILVKYLRLFYTRKIVLDGPDLFVTPRKESISGDKNDTKNAMQSAKFLVKYFFNNSKDYQPWYLLMDLKTGYDKLKIKSQGYSMVINQTKIPSPTREPSATSSGSNSAQTTSKANNSKNSLQIQKAKETTRTTRNDGKIVQPMKAREQSNQILTPFYRLRWRTIFQDQKYKFNPNISYPLKSLAWIQGHVIKLSVQLKNSSTKQLYPQETKTVEKTLQNINSRAQKNPEIPASESTAQPETGLLTRASVDEDHEKIKAYFKHERIDYLVPSLSKQQKMRLVVGNENIAPYCLKLKRRKDPTASSQYIAGWCFKPPETQLVWYSPENLNQSLILNTDSDNYQLSNIFDFFITKDRIVFSLVRKARLRKSFGSHRLTDSGREYHNPMFIFAKIVNTDSKNIIDKLQDDPKFYVMKETWKNQKGLALFSYFAVNSKQVKGNVLEIRTWDSPEQTSRSEQVIFMISFIKLKLEDVIRYELFKFKISTRQNSRKGTANDPAFWYGSHSRRYYQGFDRLKHYFFIKANSHQFQNLSQNSRFNRGNPVYILYYISGTLIGGEHRKLISTTYRTHGRDHGKLNYPKPMNELKPGLTETYTMLTPNDCKEVSHLLISCVHANNEHSMIENIFYQVKVNEEHQRIYLELVAITKYIKHQRRRYLKIKQGFKYFGVLINPFNHDQAGIYVYKKIEHGGTHYVYYYLGLSEFAERKDYDKVNFYFESGTPVKDPSSTLIDYNETLVVFSSKKNLFMRYNLTEFEVAFQEDAQYKDLKKYKMVVENFQFSEWANFTSFFQIEKEKHVNQTREQRVLDFWESNQYWIEGVLYAMAVTLVVMCCVCWVKRKARLERERISRDEDMIYDLDDFRF